jgi:actin-related protein 10
VLKTSGPELLREEYDTRVSDSLSRGATFHAAVKEERGQVPAPQLGLALDDMLPGMAVGSLADKRKRGWTPSGGLGDWTTARITAGV